jgi:signal transduction histidine kinase
VSRHHWGVPYVRRLNKNAPTGISAESILWLAFVTSVEAQVISNASRRIVSANAAAGQHFECAPVDLTGRPVRDLYAAEEDWQTISQTLRAKSAASTAASHSVTLMSPSGRHFDGLVTVKPIIDESGALCGYKETFHPAAVSGATTKAALPANLSEQARLARGLAHDFNNLLAIIGGNVQLAGQRTSDKKTKSLLREAELACEMGARLIEGIKGFAADRRLSAAEINVEELLHKQLPVFARSLGQSITLSCDVTPGLPPVFADQSGLENTILNLILNARDAMPNGGSVVIRASAIEDGHRVRISLSDTGTGMTPRVLARAFDPLFTTKPPGHGTGLGLATVYGFAKQSGGYAEIESAPGTGTTVSIILPTVAASR